MTTWEDLYGIQPDAKLTVGLHRFGLTIPDLIGYLTCHAFPQPMINIFVEFYPPYAWYEKWAEYDPDLDGADGDNGLSVHYREHEVLRPSEEPTWGVLGIREAIDVLDGKGGVVTRLGETVMRGSSGVYWLLGEGMVFHLDDLFINIGQVAFLASRLGIDKPAFAELKRISSVADGRSNRDAFVRQEIRTAVLKHLTYNLSEVIPAGRLFKTKLAWIVDEDSSFPLASYGSTKSYLSGSGKPGDLPEIYDVVQKIVRENAVGDKFRELKSEAKTKAIKKHVLTFQWEVVEALEKFK